MLIETLELISYGPFEESGVMKFEPGMNLIVGQNNSGKSALLKSLRIDPIDNPHRNREKFRHYDVLPSVQRLRIRVSGAELRAAFLSRGGDIHWPLPEPADDVRPEVIEREYFSADRSYSFLVERRQSVFAKVGDGPSHGAFDEETPWSIHLQAQAPSVTYLASHNSGQDNVVDLMLPLFMRSMFRFDAERLNIGRCPQSPGATLQPNASNLPAILQDMQGRRQGLFKKLEARLREILPSIYGITAAGVGQQEVEIMVWPTSNMDHAEHGLPLDQCGTGVAQVLAILTAVMTCEPGSIIVIDEINSFLHPAAVKALLRILMSEYPEHQYIVSTHSAEVIAASNPSSLHVVKRSGFESVCKLVSCSDVGELRWLADHLGISIGDIFAAERVLWVEGRTEELCFPYLINRFGLTAPHGLIISPVVATGDFVGGKRDFELVLSIYNRLTQVSLPLVQSVGFSFDSEDLTEGEKRELEKRSNGRTTFLPRRHLECYLIDPAAIATFIRSRDPLLPALTAGDVEAYLTAHGGDAKYRASSSWSGALDDIKWLANVDAAKLIKACVEDITEARLTFSKAGDTLELLMTVQDDAALEELKVYLQFVLKSVSED